MVEAARVMTDRSAHQFSTGNCAASVSRMMLCISRVSAVRRTKLWMRLMLPSASPARLASSLCRSSTSCCRRSVRPTTQMLAAAKNRIRTTSSTPSRQFMNRLSGSMMNRATKVARFSRKNDSQMPNRSSTPVSMTLISRPECWALWNEKGSTSTCSKKFAIAPSRRRWAMRSACSETTMLATMPPRPTTAHSTSSCRGVAPQHLGRLVLGGCAGDRPPCRTAPARRTAGPRRRRW